MGISTINRVDVQPFFHPMNMTCIHDRLLAGLVLSLGNIGHAFHHVAKDSLMIGRFRAEQGGRGASAVDVEIAKRTQLSVRMFSSMPRVGSEMTKRTQLSVWMFRFSARSLARIFKTSLMTRGDTHTDETGLVCAWAQPVPSYFQSNPALCKNVHKHETMHPGVGQDGRRIAAIDTFWVFRKPGMTATNNLARRTRQHQKGRKRWTTAEIRPDEERPARGGDWRDHLDRQFRSIAFFRRGISPPPHRRWPRPHPPALSSILCFVSANAARSARPHPGLRRSRIQSFTLPVRRPNAKGRTSQHRGTSAFRACRFQW